MTVHEANSILKLYGLQIKKKDYIWYVRQLDSTNWQYAWHGGPTEDVLQFVIQNMEQYYGK